MPAAEAERIDEQKGRVRAFWDDKPCGAKHADASEGTPEFFAQVERRREELEPFIADFADFEAARDKSVLDIGVGVGTDFVRFARAGARVTGVDLTEHAVSLVRTRLAQEGLEGRLMVADAEQLPFDDAEFDVVYSWGVLHHTPGTAAAVAEARRVLKPGGRACVMLYARRSWVGLGLWARHAVLKGRPWRSLSDVIANHMESAGTKAYTVKEVRRLFADWDDVRVDRVLTPYDRRVGGPIARLLGDRFGWFTVIRAVAPGQPPGRAETA